MNKWPASKIVTKAISELSPYAQNTKQHPEEQIRQIADSIKEFGWTMPVLIDEAGELIAGHGRVLAAELLELTEVPAMIAEGWTEEQKRAYRLADNKLAESAWDNDKLRLELDFLKGTDFDLGLTGFSALEIGSLFRETRDPYSRKIEAPIYEPKGDRPKPEELIDRRKTDKLLAKIDKAKIPDDVAAFLRAAAERHTVFSFERIAEFYCHADAKTQALMEESALVIIDFDKAIENGFVKTSKAIGRLADGDKE